MFKRIVKVASVSLAFLCMVPTGASPIGLYIKGVGSVFLGDDSKKENLLASAALAYQFNRFRMWELNFSFLTNVKNNYLESSNDVLYSFTFVDKHFIPLKYYLNLYTQYGFSYRSKLSLHAPFFGTGLAYYYNRRWHFDFSWRHYALFETLSRQGYHKSRSNSLVLGVGYHIR